MLVYQFIKVIYYKYYYDALNKTNHTGNIIIDCKELIIINSIGLKVNELTNGLIQYFQYPVI